jgi:hypothetical protein
MIKRSKAGQDLFSKGEQSDLTQLTTIQQHYKRQKIS